MSSRYSLAVALLLAAGLASPSAFANGVEAREAADGVTIFTVSYEAPEEFAGEAEAPVPTINVNNVVKVVIVQRNWRWERYRLALGQRYTGFIKVYSGPQYPF